jgi:hypothetical protein
MNPLEEPNILVGLPWITSRSALRKRDMTAHKQWFTGEELIARWGLHASELSHCLMLGLQGYSAED